MNAAILEDTTLSCMARFIMLWILRSPSEVINPEEIAETNHIPLKTVKTLLNELVDHKYLVKPKRVNDPVKAGKFTWTPYTLNPSYGQRDSGQPSYQNPSMDTAGDGVPFRAETPSAENPSMALTDNGSASTVEYTHAAGDKDSLLSLKAKDSLVLSETEKDKDRQTDSIKPIDTSTSVDAPPLDMQDNGYGKAATAFLSRIGSMKRELIDDVADAVKEYGWYPVERAIHEAADEVAKAQRGERTPIRVTTWSYARGILKKQKAEGDLPVEVVFKSDTASDDFDPFNHDDDLPEPEIEPEPVNAQWRELNDFIQSQNRELYRMHLSQCRFGTFEAGKLSVLVPTERVQTACIWELNHRGVFTKWCQDFWQGLETVEFVLEGELHAHPETG